MAPAAEAWRPNAVIEADDAVGDVPDGLMNALRAGQRRAVPDGQRPSAWGGTQPSGPGGREGPRSGRVGWSRPSLIDPKCLPLNENLAAMLLGPGSLSCWRKRVAKGPALRVRSPPAVHRLLTVRYTDVARGHRTPLTYRLI